MNKFPSIKGRRRSNATLLKMGSLQPGRQAIVADVRVDSLLLYRRLLDLGFVKDARVTAILAGPAGDPIVYRVRDARVALRKLDADMVVVRPVPDVVSDCQPDCQDGGSRPPKKATTHREKQAHIPGRISIDAAGAGSKKGPKAPPLTKRQADAVASRHLVALAGNPNTGKSTVFNALTGLRQHVGNWPGKTVGKAEGRFRHGDETFRLVDLPGTYSLISSSVEEEIARDFILFERPDCIVVVVDGTCIERNLNLVLQILQLACRVVVCVNLLDEARRKGIAVDLAALADRLGVPVVGTEARRGKGLDALKETVRGVCSGDFKTHPLQLRYDEGLDKAVTDLARMIEQRLPDVINPRWVALRLIDGSDLDLVEKL